MPEFPLPVTFVGMSQQMSCCQAIVSGVCVCKPAESKADTRRHRQRSCSVCAPPCALSLSVHVLVTLAPQD